MTTQNYMSQRQRNYSFHEPAIDEEEKKAKVKIIYTMHKNL